eukprot:g5360.t1
MEYARTIGKKLKFKGSDSNIFKKKKKKKKSKKKKKKRKKASSSSEEEEEYVPTKVLGKGRIITSNTSVTGQGDTQFSSELQVGDCIVVQHPTSLRTETRVVKMVLSQISIAISSPFSTDLITPTRFHYIKAPPKKIDKSEIQDKKRRRKISEQKGAFGTYADTTDEGSTFTYRVRKKGLGMSYHIVTERATGAQSRESLLDKRSKKKHDRYCSF